MNQLEYKGYTAVVEFSAEDDCFVGRVIGITDQIVFDGESTAELRKNFHNVLDCYLKACEKRGKTPEVPKSGKLLLRLPAELHASLAHQAARTGESVNTIIVDALQSLRHEERPVKKQASKRRTRKAKTTAGA